MAPFAELPTYSSHPSLRAYLRAVLVAAKDLENIGRYREINGIELYRYVHAFVSSSLTLPSAAKSMAITMVLAGCASTLY